MSDGRPAHDGTEDGQRDTHLGGRMSVLAPPDSHPEQRPHFRLRRFGLYHFPYFDAPLFQRIFLTVAADRLPGR